MKIVLSWIWFQGLLSTTYESLGKLFNTPMSFFIRLKCRVDNRACVKPTYSTVVICQFSRLKSFRLL